MNPTFRPSATEGSDVSTIFATSAIFLVQQLTLAGLDGAGGRDTSAYFEKEDLNLPCQEKVFKAFCEKALQQAACTNLNSDQQDDIIFLLKSVDTQKLYTAIKEQARIGYQEKVNEDQMGSHFDQAISTLGKGR
jgi:hypothetical protein